MVYFFTCLTTGAVLFEVVPSPNTSSCVISFEKFVSRKGVSVVMWFDNRTYFFADEKELLNNFLNWDQEVFTATLVLKCIKWKFKPPSAPYHEGVWERLVISLKHVFYAIIGNTRLTDEFLITKFGLVEQSLSARTLVPASADVTNLDIVTRIFLTMGTGCSSLPSTLSSDIDHRRR